MPQSNQGLFISDAAQIGPDTVGASEIAANSVGDSEIAAHTTTKITADLALVTGALALAKGGTGQITKEPAYDALSPNTTHGDITYRNGTVNTRLPIGASSTFLKSNGAGQNPSWAALSSSKRVAQFITDVTVSNTTTETNLFSFTLDAADMGVNDVMHVRVNLDNMTTQGAGTVNLFCYFGATAIDLWNFSGAAFASVRGYIDFFIYANGATNSQVLTAYVFGSPEGSGGGGVAANIIYNQITGTSAIDTTAAVTVKIAFKAAVGDPATNMNATDGFAVLYR